MAITGSIQEKNGRYHMVINVPTEDGKTKQKWFSTGLKTRGNKKEAQRMLEDKLSELNKYNISFNRITVADYFRSWLPSVQKDVRPNTYRTYRSNMLNHIIPYFEKNQVLLQEIKPYHLEKYYSSLLQAGSRLQGGGALSPTTIKHHHQSISKALSDAVRRELILYNPASAAKTPKAERFKSEYLDPKQIREMLTLFRGSVVEIPVMLCAIYGFRRSEVCGLKWQCVDFNRRTITIAETLQQNTGGDYVSKPKTESSYRTLPMTESVYETLKAQKQLQSKRRSIMGKYYVDNDYVCTWRNGQVISPNYLTRAFKNILSKSSLPDIRLHDLRHSVATNLLQSGVQVVDVQEWLGHANASTTLNIYSHAAKSSKNDIARRLQAMINASE